MKKSFFSLLLCLFFLLSSCAQKAVDSPGESAETPATPDAAKTYITAEPDNYSWPAAAAETDFQFDAETGTITKYTGSANVVVIPEKIGGSPVLSIDRAFDMNETLTHVKIPEGVRKINGTFYSCTKLELVSLPDSLGYIGEFTFFLNFSLSSVVIPKQTVFIGKNAFAACDALKKLTFLGEIPLFEMPIFTENLENPPELFVADEEREAFQEALGLPCTAKGSVNLVQRVPDASDFDFDPASGTIKSYLGKASAIEIPAAIDAKPVKAIGDEAFSSASCRELLFRVDLPTSLQSIGKRSFFQDKYLTAVHFSEGLQSIGEEAFAFAKLSDFTLPQSLKTLGEGSFMGIHSRDVVIPSGVEVLPKNLFNSSNIVNMTIPASVKEIKEGVFVNSYSLEYLAFEGRTLPTMTQTSFYAKPETATNHPLKIVDIDIAWDATREEAAKAKQFFLDMGLSEGAFTVWRADRPDAAPYPSEEHVFEFDDNTALLTSYKGPGSAMTMFWRFYAKDGNQMNILGLGEGLFKDSKITKFYVPHSNEFSVIGDQAFAGSTLQFIDLFDSVKTIGNAAFKNCQELTAIVIPDSVQQIGAEAFAGCTKLEQVKFLGTEVAIGTNAFANCPALKQLILPAKTTAEGALTENLSAIRVADSATEEEISALKQALGLPWYLSKLRESEPGFTVMTETPSPESEFEIDATTGTITKFSGSSETVVIPRMIGTVQVKRLGQTLFSSYEHPIKKIVIPETVTAIEPFAFSQNMSIETVICYGPIEEMGADAFENCKMLRDIRFVNGLRTLSDNCFAFCSYLKQFEFNEWITRIPDSAFSGCGLTGALKLDVESIELRAFANNPNLTEIHLSARIKQIGTGAFQGLEKLTKLSLEKADPALFEDYTSKFGDSNKLQIILPADTADDILNLIVEKINSFGLPGSQMVQRQ